MSATNTIVSADIEKYLSNAPFPCEKQALISFAKSRNAPREVIDALNGLQNKEYTSLTEVSDQIAM